MHRQPGFWVEITALARVRVQVFIPNAESQEVAVKAALEKVATGNISPDEWHFEGGDTHHRVSKVRGG